MGRIGPPIGLCEADAGILHCAPDMIWRDCWDRRRPASECMWRLLRQAIANRATGSQSSGVPMAGVRSELAGAVLCFELHRWEEIVATR